MSILRSKLLRKVVIAGLSLIVVLVSVSVIDKKIHFISKVNQEIGEVAGIFLADKFLDNLIPDTVSAQILSPYQDITGDVAISGAIRSNYNNYGFVTSPKQFHMAENATWDPVNGWTAIQTGKSAIIQTYAQDGNYALFVQADNTSRVAGAARSFTIPFAVTMDGKTCINGDCRPAWPTSGPQIQRGTYTVAGLGGNWGRACTSVSFSPAFSAPPAVATSAWNTDAGDPWNASSNAVYITASGMQFCIVNTDGNSHTIRGSWIATW